MDAKEGMQYTRICPGCSTLLQYKSALSRDNCIQKKTVCRRCSRLGTTIPAITRAKMSIAHQGRAPYKVSTTSRLRQRAAALKRWGHEVDVEKYVREVNSLPVQYSRDCPQCNISLVYSDSSHFRDSENNNSRCLSCANRGREYSDEVRHNMSLAQYKRYGTEQQELLYTEGDLNYWSRKVKRRDNYRCYICNGTDRLEAHHILSRAKHPAYALCVANGMTLCATCHKEDHRLFGLS